MEKKNDDWLQIKKGVQEFIANVSNKTLNEKGIVLSVKSMENSKALKYHTSSMKDKFFLLFVTSVVVITIQYNNLMQYSIPALIITLTELKFHLLVIIYSAVNVF